jgi:hypothetical protein
MPDLIRPSVTRVASDASFLSASRTRARTQGGCNLVSHATHASRTRVLPSETRVAWRDACCLASRGEGGVESLRAARRDRCGPLRTRERDPGSRRLPVDRFWRAASLDLSRPPLAPSRPVEAIHGRPEAHL